MTSASSITTGTRDIAGTYALDPSHTRIGFVARHAMVTKVRGAFKELTGSGYFDADTPSASHFELKIAAASVDTGNPDRDAHLRSNDFFDVENYPEITFVSSGVEGAGEGRYTVRGDLTIKGITRPVSFELEVTGPVADPWGNTRIGLEGTTTVNRKDWGVNWNAALEAGGVLVSEKVTLEFDVAAVKSA